MTNKSRRLGISILLLIIIAAIIMTVFMLGCHYADRVWGTILSSISLLLLGWLMIATLHRIIRQTWVVALLLLLLYGYGVFVYKDIISLQKENTIVSILSPVNNTLSVFFPSRGSYSEVNGLSANIHFQSVHLLSYLFFALIGFSLFGRRIINRSGYRVIPYGYKNIFWGESSGGMLLANDILDKTLMQQIIFVHSKHIREEVDRDRVLFEQIDLIGAIALYRDFDRMIRIPDAHRHFFMTEDEDFNVMMALQVAFNTKRKHKTNLYVRTEREEVGQLFKDAQNIEIYIFNQSDLTARKFIKDHPMLDAVPADRIENMKVNFDFRLLVLGFGPTGREMMNKCLCDSQFMGSSFAATVVDRDYARCYGNYETINSECIKKYNIEFIEDSDINSIGSTAFYRWAAANIGGFNRIIVSLGEDRLNLDIATTLARMLEMKGIKSDRVIFAQVKDSNRYCYDKFPITLFGQFNSIYSYEVVIDQKIDQLAKAVNYVYCHPEIDLIDDLQQHEDEAEAIWSHSNNIFNKNSSRAVGMNIDNIIRVAGGRDAFAKAIEDAQALEILAENEHLRWQAFHYTKGVRSWDSIPAAHSTDAKLFRNSDKNDILLRHACLVSFAELTAVAERVNHNREQLGKSGHTPEDFQETDRRITRHYLLFKDIINNETSKL